MKVRFGRRELEVRETIPDRIAGWFSPHARIERLNARGALMLASGGYEGGRRDRRHTRKWRPPEASANSDILPDLPDLRGRSRDLSRNNPIATGAIATVVTNVVGDGLMLQAQVDRAVVGFSEEQAITWQAQADREWELACETIDFTRAQTFYEMQALAFRAVLESGDVLLVRRYRKDVGDIYGTKLQLVEADRICNENRAADKIGQIAGVVFDADGVARGYKVANRHPNDHMMGSTALAWINVPANDPTTGRPLALLLTDRLRPDQARGVPYLAPVVEALKELGDYTDYEARAALLTGMLTVFLENTVETDEGAPPTIGSNDSSAGVDAAREIAIEDAGAVIDLPVGTKANVSAPGRPNAGPFDSFVLALCRQIGVALELPYELLVKHFTASYSASRAALEMAWQFFRKRRSFIAWRLCQPVYEWVIEEAVAMGRLSAPGFFDDPIIRQAYCGSDWIGPVRPNLQPKYESEADEIDLRLGVKTRKQIVMERTGGTFIGKHEQLVREEKMRRDAGLTSEPPKQAAAKPAPSDEADEKADRPDTEDET